MFVGIEFPDEIVEELMEIQNQIRSHTKRGRFVSRDNLHLTLEFLGEVSAQAVEPIVRMLCKTAQEHNAFSLVLNDVGSFGSRHLYRVVWAGIGGDTKVLSCLQKDISISLATLGFPQETRPYQPHVTLGRDLEFVGTASFEEYSKALTKVPFLVKRFSLIESNLENGKRIYHSRYSIPLGYIGPKLAIL